MADGRGPAGKGRRAAHVPPRRSGSRVSRSARPPLRARGRGARMTTSLLGDVSALLGPVEAKAPAGADLRYLPVYDEIKAARREAEVDPRELAPWKRIAGLVANALTRSKDLQLAAWLAEALARVEGFPGTAAGLLVTRRLLD